MASHTLVFLSLGLLAALGSAAAQSTGAANANGLWILSNNPVNTVASYAIEDTGRLRLLDAGQPTGGNGTGTDLSSSHATLVGEYNGRPLLFAVNPGSNSVTTFQINADQTLSAPVAQRQLQGGQFPCSLAFTNVSGTVCALTCAGAGTLECWSLTSSGTAGNGWPATALDVRQTNATAFDPFTGPTDVVFTPDGSQIVVLAKSTGLHTYSFSATQGPRAVAVATNSVAPIPRVPFAITLRRSVSVPNAVDVFVPEAIAPPCTFPDPTTNSSPPPGICNGSIAVYTMGQDGQPRFVSRLDGGAFAPCWSDYFQGHLYTGNSGGPSFGVYSVSDNNQLAIAQLQSTGGPIGPADQANDEGRLGVFGGAQGSLSAEVARVRTPSGRNLIFNHLRGYGDIVGFMIEPVTGLVQRVSYTRLPKTYRAAGVGMSAA